MYALIRATSKKHNGRSKAPSPNTPPPKNSDDTSFSLSSWACLDTENQNSVDRILNPRLHSSDAVINYNHDGPTSANKNRKPQPPRDDDASISMSSWANITTEVQNENTAAKSRHLCTSASDRAIGYTPSSHHRPPVPKKKAACPPTPRNSVSSKAGHHSKEDSWGQMDVLFMANIAECREEAAKEVMKNRQIDNTASQEQRDKEYHVQPRTVAADSGTPTRRRSSTKRDRKLPPRWKGRPPLGWRSVQTKRVF